MSGISVFKRAAVATCRGGMAGFLSMILQVISLMWLRTVVNYQYRSDASITEAFQTLWKEGGIARFYRGVWFALIMGPLSRFGDTAANEGVKDYFSGSSIHPALTTVVASLGASIWRMLLTPLDTLKSNFQVSGASTELYQKINHYGLSMLFEGAMLSWLIFFIGHYSWFVMNNVLEKYLPSALTGRKKVFRRGFIGLCAALVTDFVTNGIRVVKTYKQTYPEPLTYMQAVAMLMNKSGIFFAFRGLGVKFLVTALSSILFSILWKLFLDYFQAVSVDRCRLPHLPRMVSRRKKGLILFILALGSMLTVIFTFDTAPSVNAIPSYDARIGVLNHTNYVGTKASELTTVNNTSCCPPYEYQKELLQSRLCIQKLWR